MEGGEGEDGGGDCGQADELLELLVGGGVGRRLEAWLIGDFLDGHFGLAVAVDGEGGEEREVRVVAGVEGAVGGVVVEHLLGLQIEEGRQSRSCVVEPLPDSSSTLAVFADSA